MDRTTNVRRYLHDNDKSFKIKPLERFAAIIILLLIIVKSCI